MTFKELTNFDETVVSLSPFQGGMLVATTRNLYMFKEGVLEELKFELRR